MNLPGAIEALETPTGIPQALQDKMNIVKKEGGAGLILEQIEALNKLGEEDAAICARASAALDMEEKEDNEIRSRYGNRWQRYFSHSFLLFLLTEIFSTRTPSHTLTANLRQEAARFKGNIDHARKSDSFILKKFQDHQQYIVLLTGSKVQTQKNSFSLSSFCP
jgi:programmed cell death 6-interacting protein